MDKMQVNPSGLPPASAPLTSANLTKWKYIEMKERYDAIVLEYQALSGRLKSATKEWIDTRDMREFLASKWANMRYRRFRQIDTVPETPFLLFCQDTYREMRKLYPEATRKELRLMQRMEWETMTQDHTKVSENHECPVKHIHRH